MKKHYIPFIALALGFLLLPGCSNDVNTPEAATSKDCPDFSARIGELPSRAVDSEWEAGDEIGVSGASRTNVCYRTADGDGTFSVKTRGEQIYFQSDEEVLFTAYYPWNNLNGDVSSINVDTKNQSQQKTFDFLWAQATGQKSHPDVSFNFAHKMAKLSLTLKPGTDMSYEELKSASFAMNGIKHSGSFKVADGTTTTTETAGDNWTFTDFLRLNEAEGTVTFNLIFFPQTFDGPIEFMAGLTSADNKPLTLKAGIDFTSANREKDGANARNEWVTGRQYNLTLTLNKTDISINDCVIIPWNRVEGDEISVD